MSEPTEHDVRNEDMVYDVRLVPHSLRRGRLTLGAIDEHLAALPDDAELAVECDVVFGTPYAQRAKREAGKS